MSVLEAANGIHRIANARIMRALRAVSTERGRDTRDFALICFGGSGPVHAAPLARELSVRRIIIPPLPGLFSALGLLSSSVEHHDVRSCLLAGDPSSFPSLEKIARDMKSAMIARLETEGFGASQVSLHFSFDVRYQGQSSEIRVAVAIDELTSENFGGLRARFQQEYERLYGHTASLEDPIEIVAGRLVGRVNRAETLPFRLAESTIADSLYRSAWFEGRMIETAVVSRQSLTRELRGPLLIDEYDSTTVVPPDMSARLDEYQNILLSPEYD